MTTQNIFARKNDDGNYDILETDEGCPITQMEAPTMYPVGSGVSCCYEHPEGIKLTFDDVQKLGIEVE